MKNLPLILACAIGLALSACAGAPSQTQAQQIQTACAIDAGLRPSIDVLLAVPGVAQPNEVAAIGVARSVIDPVCANPGGTYQANTITAFTAATAQVAGILTKLQGRYPAKGSTTQ